MQKTVARVFLADVSGPEQEKSDDELAMEAWRRPAAFATLYRRYAVGVYRYLYGRVGNRTDAEDLTSQTFTQVLEALPGYRPQGRFAAWLFSIARRRAADFHREGHRRVELPLEALDVYLANDERHLGQVIQTETVRDLRQLYDQLTEEQQELIRLRFAAGMTYAQIGQVLKRSEMAIGMALHRLMLQLRRQLEEQEESDEPGN